MSNASGRVPSGKREIWQTNVISAPESHHQLDHDKNAGFKIFPIIEQGKHF